MKKRAWMMVAGALLMVGGGQGWAEPYSTFLDAPTLPALYGKQAQIKTPQKVFRLNDMDPRDGTYPWVQVSIGGEKLEFFPVIQPPYIAGDRDPVGALMPVYFVFRKNSQEPATFTVDPSTWKLVTVDADKLLYVNPMVKLADALDSSLRDINILWEATKEPYIPTKYSVALPAGPGSIIEIANYDISHALKVARNTTQGRTLPQMFLVIGDALAYEIPPYTLPQSGPDKAAVDRIVENVEKALMERR